MEAFEHQGRLELLENSSVAFFCSTRCDGDAVLKAYEWARRQCDLGTTVIGGFHTPVEKDIYAILARRCAKLIHCYAKRLPLKRPTPEQRELMNIGRLLLITPKECANLPRPSKQSCSQRNRFVADKAEYIYVASMHAGSALMTDLNGFEGKFSSFPEHPDNCK